MMRTLKTLSLLLLSLAVLVTSVIAYRLAHPDHKSFDTSHEYPDAIATKLDIVTMDKTGNPKSRLQSMRSTHFSLQAITNFIEPRITLFPRTQKQPWHFSAKRGQARHNHQAIELWNNVVIHEPAGNNNAAMTLNTHDLVFYPDKHLSETSWPVTLLRPGVVTHAIGMKAYTKQQRMVLLSDVKTDYTPD